jgi:phage FluMu protein Com
MYEHIRRDIAYVRGLFESNEKSLDRKGLDRLLNALDELIELNVQLETRVNELEDYLEEVDEDLNELELAVYDDSFEDERGMLEVYCPHCKEEVLVDEEDLEHQDVEILCPKCSSVLNIDMLEDIDKESSSSSSYSNL